jgi:hypothetical protein
MKGNLMINRTALADVSAPVLDAQNASGLQYKLA